MNLIARAEELERRLAAIHAAFESLTQQRLTRMTPLRALNCLLLLIALREGRRGRCWRPLPRKP